MAYHIGSLTYNVKIYFNWIKCINWMKWINWITINTEIKLINLRNQSNLFKINQINSKSAKLIQNKLN